MLGRDLPRVAGLRLIAKLEVRDVDAQLSFRALAQPKRKRWALAMHDHRGRNDCEPHQKQKRCPRALSGDALRGLAAKLQTSPATLAIAFTLLHPLAGGTLIGATRPTQIDAAIGAVALAGRLSADDVAALRRVADQTA